MNLTKLIKSKPNEKIIAVFRQCGVTYLGPMAISFLLLVMPFFLLALLFSRGWLGALLFSVLLAVGLWYSLRNLVHWYYNLCVITNQRIIDVDQRGFFDRTVSEVSYHKIQDVSYRVRGIFPTLFHFGTVIIQTAASTALIEFGRMKNPDEIVDLVNEFREQIGRGEPQENPRENELASYVRGLSREELKFLIQEARKRVREEAMEDFFRTENREPRTED